jgi:N-acetylneuraminic acid mutarotase
MPAEVALRREHVWIAIAAAISTNACTTIVGISGYDECEHCRDGGIDDARSTDVGPSDFDALDLDASGSDRAWTATGTMATARMSHQAITLLDGRVLVVGGVQSEVLSSVEIYDPAHGTFSSANSMRERRIWFGIAKIAGGRILVSGGASKTTGGALSTAEVYDPVTNRWSAVASMKSPRLGHRMIGLPSGKALVVGDAPTPEIYDPATDRWTALAASIARAEPIAVLLPTGKILVAGGFTHSSAELYDVDRDSWSSAGAMSIARARAAAALLPSGKVLVVGGGNGEPISSAEQYDPIDNVWRSAGTMATDRDLFAFGALPSGKVLVAGGMSAADSTTPIAGAELYDPSTNAWGRLRAMPAPIVGATASVLASGAILVAGGSRVNFLGATGAQVATAQLFTLLGRASACGSPAECGSGFCADGVCCDLPCTSPCSACDVVGQVGLCSAVARGPLHGTRSCAPYDTCTDGVCSARCANDEDCSSGNRCDGGACVPE